LFAQLRPRGCCWHSGAVHHYQNKEYSQKEYEQQAAYQQAYDQGAIDAQAQQQLMHRLRLPQPRLQHQISLLSSSNLHSCHCGVLSDEEFAGSQQKLLAG